MKLQLLFFAGILTASGVGYAQDMNSGNHWFETCSNKQSFQSVRCTSFMFGIDEGIALQVAVARRDRFLCVPEGVTYGQKIDVFVKYLSENPESRHERASLLYALAMTKAYPCK